MPIVRSLSSLLILLVLVIPASAQSPPTTKPRFDVSGLLPALSGGSTDALAGALRGYLVHNLPDPLYESWPGWGTTRGVVVGVKWKGQGIDVHPETIYKRKNDGKWRHVRAAAVAPADNLVFDIRDAQYPEAGRFLFTVFLSCDGRVDYEQQTWKDGVRLHSSSARARLRIKAALQCEASYHLDAGQSFVPDAVFRLHVTHADISYDNFVLEHGAGLGGEAARVLGEAVQAGLHRWDPGLERELLTKAGAAIEKAADTKDVRVSAYDLFKKKGWLK